MITTILGNVVRIGPKSNPILVQEDGVLTNPDTITIEIIRPDGTTATGTPINHLDAGGVPIAGTFYYDYQPASIPAMEKLHHYRITTTNPNGVYEGDIYFEHSRFIT